MSGGYFGYDQYRFNDVADKIDRLIIKRGFDGDILDVVAWNKSEFTAYLDKRYNTRDNLLRLFPWVRVLPSPDKKLSQFLFPTEALRRS